MDDLIIDENYDLVFSQGDFQVGNADQQNVQNIFKARYGQFRQFPLVGIGIDAYLNGSVNLQGLKRIIRTQLEADDYVINKLEIGYVDGQLDINLDARKR